MPVPVAPTDVHDPVARAEHEVHRLLLFRVQTIGRHESGGFPQRFASANTSIDSADHFPLAREAFDGRKILAVVQDLAREFLEGECACQFLVAELSSAVAEGLSENLVTARDRDPFEDMIFRILERNFGGRTVDCVAGWLRLQAGEQASFVRIQPLALAHAQIGCRNFNQLVGAGLPDENGYFVVGRAAARFLP